MTFDDYIREVSHPSREVATVDFATFDGGHDIDHMPTVVVLQNGDQRLVVVPYTLPGNLTCEITLWDGDMQRQREWFTCRPLA